MVSNSKRSEYRSVVRNRVLLLCGVLLILSSAGLPSLLVDKLTKGQDFVLSLFLFGIGVLLLVYTLADAVVRTIAHYVRKFASRE